MKKYLFLILMFCFLSCENQDDNLVVLQGNAIGTTFSIRFLDTSKHNFEPEIYELIAEINKSVSTYIPTSDISKINKGDTTVVVDEYFVEVFHKSNRIFEETNGDFDPTVGILVNAWGFGPEDAVENLDSLKIEELLQFVGFDKVSLNNNKITKQYPQIYFDFNAIAKGFLVDMVGRNFEAKGVENYMVEIGGEIRARGVNEKNTAWRIAIENPNEDGSRSLRSVVQLHNESIATSGNYRKYRTTPDGKKYVHTINTKTGFASESNLLSASVIAKTDCADVDGYATAFMAMGLTKTLQFLENHPELKVFLIYVDENHEIKTYNSPNLIMEAI